MRTVVEVGAYSSLGWPGSNLSWLMRGVIAKVGLVLETGEVMAN